MEWLNYHHLFYFWMTVKTGTVAAAAESLHLARPTVAVQIKDLEKSYQRRLPAVEVLTIELARYLTERLPAMIAPRWILNPVQPIAVDDVVAYLLAAVDRHAVQVDLVRRRELRGVDHVGAVTADLVLVDRWVGHKLAAQ